MTLRLTWTCLKWPEISLSGQSGVTSCQPPTANHRQTFSLTASVTSTSRSEQQHRVQSANSSSSLSSRMSGGDAPPPSLKWKRAGGVHRLIRLYHLIALLLANKCSFSPRGRRWRIMEFNRGEFAHRRGISLVRLIITTSLSCLKSSSSLLFCRC